MSSANRKQIVGSRFKLLQRAVGNGSAVRTYYKTQKHEAEILWREMRDAGRSLQWFPLSMLPALKLAQVCRQM